MSERVPRPSWTECRADFDRDGALRDIYVESTSLADWDRLLEWLRSSSLRMSFRHDGEPASLPGTAREIFALSGTASSLLTVHLGPLAINCHFFSDDEIEMDLDPGEVADASSFDLLLGFVENLGEVLRRDVLVTQENFKTAELLRYSAAAGRFERQSHV